MIKTNASRLPVFDGLRAIAIILVLVGHSAGAYSSTAELSVMPWLFRIADNGAFGVRLFFVLSGYLITSLLIKERLFAGKVSIGQFYARRFLRILPAFFAYLLTIGVLTGLEILFVARAEFIAAGTFTWNYRLLWLPAPTADGSWFLGHMWTLSLEEQFYIIWPFLFVLCTHSRLLFISLAAVPAFPLMRLIGYFAFPEQRGSLGMMFHTAADSIFIGCAFALLREFGRPAIMSGRPRLGGSVRQVRIRAKLLALLDSWASSAAAPSVVGWIGVIAFPLIVSPILRAEFGGAYTITVGFTLEALCAGLIVGWMHSGTSALILHKLISSAPMAWIGRLSYSLYLWQQLFLTPLNTTWTGQFPACLVAVFLLASLSYYWIERPVLRMKNRLALVSLEDSNKSGTVLQSSDGRPPSVSSPLM